jgi:hypothetical protein
MFVVYYYLRYHHYAFIYNYVLETNQVSVVCNDTAALYVQFVLHVMLFLS